MEFVLLGLIVLSFPIIAIVALVKSVGLNDRLRRLELQFDALETRLASGVAPATPAAAPLPGAVVQQPPAAEPPRPAEPAEAPPEPSRAAEPEPVAAASVPPVAATSEPAAPELSLEERFGTKWVVWVGGVALALGGIFLVRYSIEAGLLGPKVRLFLSALFAAVLVAGGEWTQAAGAAFRLRRPAKRAHSKHPDRGGYHSRFRYGLCGLCAVWVLAPASAFILLGIVALATLAAALLHGPALAGLGLVGAYVTPLLVSSGEPSFWTLYIYLAVVTAATFALANYRLWLGLAVTALAFHALWLIPGFEAAPVSALPAHMFHMSVGFALAAAFIVTGLFWGPAGRARQDRRHIVDLDSGLPRRRPLCWC